MSRLSLTEAGRRIGVTRQTIYAYKRKGLISVKRGSDGKPYIDESELLRAFPDAKPAEQKQPPAKAEKTAAEPAESWIDVSGEMARMEQQIADLKADKQRLLHDVDMMHAALAQANHRIDELIKANRPMTLLRWLLGK